MSIITLKHNGIIYQRTITRESNGDYIMHFKGQQYWFRKDSEIETYRGWHLVNDESLPDFMMELITTELEKLNNQVKPIIGST